MLASLHLESYTCEMDVAVETDRKTMNPMIKPRTCQQQKRPGEEPRGKGGKHHVLMQMKEAYTLWKFTIVVFVGIGSVTDILCATLVAEPNSIPSLLGE